jgi:hypothetical protein
MVSRWGASPAALAFFLACVSAGAPARAQSAADRESARSYMQEGRDLRDRRDLGGALRRFQAADAIMHVPTTGLEVARTQAMLRKLVEARDTISAIQRLPASPSDPPQFKEARKRADELDATLDARIPSLTINVTGVPADATPAVTIDGARWPDEALGLPRRLDPGHHVVVASAGGREGKQEVDLREGETKTVAVELSSAAPPAEAAVVPPPSAPEEREATASPRGPRTLMWAGFGVAGVGLVAGLVTGYLSLQKKSDLDSACTPDKRCPPSTYDELDSANTLATVSTVSFVVAGLGAGVGVLGFFLSKPPSAATSGVRVEPWFSAGRAGVRGTF